MFVRGREDFLRRRALSLCSSLRPHPSTAAPRPSAHSPAPVPLLAAVPPSLHRRSPVPSLRGPVLALPSPSLDEIGRIRRIWRHTQPQLVGHAGRTNELLVGYAGSTDELLVGVYPTAPLKTAPSSLDSACLLLAARVQTTTASRWQVYWIEKRYRGMKQASRCAWRPATALIVALTKHRGRLDRACRPPVNAWLCATEMNPASSPLQPGQSFAGAGDEPCVCAGDGALHLLSPLAIRE